MSPLSSKLVEWEFIWLCTQTAGLPFSELQWSLNLLACGFRLANYTSQPYTLYI